MALKPYPRFNDRHKRKGLCKSRSKTQAVSERWCRKDIRNRKNKEPSTGFCACQTEQNRIRNTRQIVQKRCLCYKRKIGTLCLFVKHILILTLDFPKPTQRTVPLRILSVLKVSHSSHSDLRHISHPLEASRPTPTEDRNGRDILVVANITGAPPVVDFKSQCTFLRLTGILTRRDLLYLHRLGESPYARGMSSQSASLFPTVSSFSYSFLYSCSAFTSASAIFCCPAELLSCFSSRRFERYPVSTRMLGIAAPTRT